MIRALRIWWWKYRFIETLLVLVAKERTGYTVRFCEACADDAWEYFMEKHIGTWQAALREDPVDSALSMTQGGLSSFRIPT